MITWLIYSPKLYLHQLLGSKFGVGDWMISTDIMMSESWYPHQGESIWRISTDIIIRGVNTQLYSFSLNHGFSHWVLLVRFLMRQYQKRIRRTMYNQWSFKGECYEYYNYVYECPFVTPTFVTPIHWTWEWISYLSVVILVMYRLWILEPINSALSCTIFTPQ